MGSTFLKRIGTPACEVGYTIQPHKRRPSLFFFKAPKATLVVEAGFRGTEE